MSQHVAMKFRGTRACGMDEVGCALMQIEEPCLENESVSLHALARAELSTYGGLVIATAPAMHAGKFPLQISKKRKRKD